MHFGVTTTKHVEKHLAMFDEMINFFESSKISEKQIDHMFTTMNNGKTGVAQLQQSASFLKIGSAIKKCHIKKILVGVNLIHQGKKLGADEFTSFVLSLGKRFGTILDASNAVFLMDAREYVIDQWLLLASGTITRETQPTHTGIGEKIFLCRRLLGLVESIKIVL